MTLGPSSLDRMEAAVEKVRERLSRAAAALSNASVPYAVVGGNAVAAWVERHGEGGVRNTPNVDLLIDRADLVHAVAALEGTGFVGMEKLGLFQDGPDGVARTRLRLLFANEKVQEADVLPNPSCQIVEYIGPYAVLPLAALVQMKLTAYRIVDRVHLCDLLDIGLIDASWKDRYPAELADRLQSLIDAPDG